MIIIIVNSFCIFISWEIFLTELEIKDEPLVPYIMQPWKNHLTIQVQEQFKIPLLKCVERTLPRCLVNFSAICWGNYLFIVTLYLGFKMKT